MKYKVGDKVKLKSYKEIERSYVVDKNSEEIWEKLKGNRVVTIAEIQKEDAHIKEYYRMEETGIWSWNENMVECLVIEKIYTKFTRFEIMEI